MRKLAILSILLASSCVPPAYAQAPDVKAHCAPHKQALANLARIGAVLLGAGLSDTGLLVQLFKSEGEWLILGTRPDGMTCALDAGRDWEVLTPEPTGPQA